MKTFQGLTFMFYNFRRAREEHRKSSSLNNDEATSITSATNALMKNATVNGAVNGIKKINGMNGTNGLINGSQSPLMGSPSSKGPAPQPPTAQMPQQMQPQPQSQPQPSSSPPSSLDALIPRPASHDAMIQWYHDIEIAKGAGLESVDSPLPCKWFVFGI